jgi:hypothetical protein
MGLRKHDADGMVFIPYYRGNIIPGFCYNSVHTCGKDWEKGEDLEMGDNRPIL